MAYRGVKGSDPFVSKTSRNERFKQMSKQEQIIEQKKLEIQAKMQEIKAKQAVENVKKSNPTNTSNLPVTKINSVAKKEDEKPTLISTVNLFANDGSFLDQFKKISHTKPSVKQEPLEVKNEEKSQEKKEERNERSERSERIHENIKDRRWNGDKSREWENRRDRRRSESKWGKSSDRRRSSSSSPSPPRHRPLQSPDLRKNYHPPPNPPRNQFNACPPPNINQSSSIPSLVTQPIIQMTNVPPPNMRNISQNVPRHNHSLTPMKKDNYSNLENHGVNSRMSLPPMHMIRPPPPPALSLSSTLPLSPVIGARPPNTNVPPPSINMSKNISMNCSPSNTGQHIISQQHHPPPTCNISSMGSLQPQNVMQPNLLPPMSQMPPNMLPMNQQIVVSVSNITNIPPPPVMPPMLMTAPPPVLNVSSTINTVPPPNLNIPPPNVPLPSIIQSGASTPSQCTNPTHLLPTTYPIQNQVSMSVNRPNVQIPPPVRPPTTLASSTDHAGHTCPVEAEQLARIVAECGDAIEQEVREKNAQDPKLWFLHQKQSAAYLQYRGLVAEFRAEKADKDGIKKGSGAELYCPEEALNDNDKVNRTSLQNTSLIDNSKEESREERKRKRQSRWSEPDNTASVSEIKPVQQNFTMHQVCPPGISMIGPPNQMLGIPPPKILNAKGKNPMLTKICRNDPALIQYARQTFGTLELSEEQWKKAEDHYKINLLYQNLLKKREEVKRLESQGKHKYEYDSDEETEGGTWEHKLRSAEMEATQMWAEELNTQSEGKHHIGDFLPPDELKKFMEQYSALKQGKEPDLSDYKEYKLKEDNRGFQMLQKLGWSEGQGLGSEGSGRVEPVNKATSRLDSAGLGSERPDGISRDDDEFDAYRKRMMLAYRFRPNPLNNPRRPYY